MNVKFDSFSTSDVAEILKVSNQSVATWCRKGHIKAVNVSDGTAKARWMIPDSEVDRVSTLMKTYGKVRWCHHSSEGIKPVTQPSQEIIPEEPKEEIPVRRNDVMENVNKIADIVYKIADLDDEEENLRARLKQIENEREDYKKQVMDLL